MARSENKKKPLYPYPLIRNGGLFLIVIGISILATLMVGNTFVLSTGMTMALLSLILSNTLAISTPAKVQESVLFSSIIIGFALIIFMVNMLEINIVSKTHWIYFFIILGFYVFHLSFYFGPLFQLSGCLLILNASLGILFQDLSTEMLIIMQGGTNIGFGAAVLFFPSSH